MPAGTRLLDREERSCRNDGLAKVEIALSHTFLWCFACLVPREEARDILLASDVALVFLRRSDVFETVIPSKMLEAFAAGCPVMLGVRGEAKRILEEARAGVAIEPEDHYALAAAVADLADCPRRRAEMAAAGRLFVDREYNRAKWATRYLGIFEDVARPSCSR